MRIYSRGIEKRAKVYVFVSITDDMLRNKTEGLTPSKAIRSFILACNERGGITETKVQDARYMARYGISQMR
jgi:hypothetical protein